MGDNYRSDLGFIRRTDIFKLYSQAEYNIWPSGTKVQKHRLAFTPIYIWRPELDMENSDYTIVTTWEAEFRNTSRLEVEVFSRFTRLYDEFDPTGSEDGLALPGDSDYYYTSLDLSFRSDQRKEISYSIGPSYGEFYNGTKFSLRGRLSWRLQPYFSGSIEVNYDKINLANPYPDADIWLIGPRLDITFNKNMFWATFIQYSNQRDNFSINSRFQWRFAPLSDLYLVYNDNYFVNNIFAPRVRSLNLKLTYWLNI